MPAGIKNVGSKNLFGNIISVLTELNPVLFFVATKCTHHYINLTSL